MLDPKSTNYLKENNPAIIASHIAAKIKSDDSVKIETPSSVTTSNIMNNKGNKAEIQYFIGRIDS
jgi:hypothetical protein